MATKSKPHARRAASGRKASPRKKTAHSRAKRNSDLQKMLAVLEDDHSKVDKIFKRYEKLKDANDSSRFELVGKACAMLKVHTALEEELLYPGAREALGDDEDMVDEAEVEHGSAKQLIADLERMKTSDPLYDAKFKVLGEYIEHHVEEEEDEMFPKLRKIAGDQFDGLFARMKEMREALEAETEESKPRQKRVPDHARTAGAR